MVLIGSVDMKKYHLVILYMIFLLLWLILTLMIPHIDLNYIVNNQLWIAVIGVLLWIIIIFLYLHIGFKATNNLKMSDLCKKLNTIVLGLIPINLTTVLSENIASSINNYYAPRYDGFYDQYFDIKGHIIMYVITLYLLYVFYSAIKNYIKDTKRKKKSNK